MAETTENPQIRCPTCGARQVPSPECRRCKCDLALYLAALEKHRQFKTRALGLLRAGRYAEAAEEAGRYRKALPDNDAARLCAVANLLAGRHEEALEAYYDIQGGPER